MAKSQQTYAKNEKEKLKLKRKKEKEEKKEERKANSKDVKFEDMIAYVDEYGNLSSTPPDPLKKKTIVNSDDIQLGAAKKEDLDPSSRIRTGIVTFFNAAKGYGFIKDSVSQQNVFVHLKGLLSPIKENNRVTFEIENTPKGPSAVQVKVTG
ncbi:MAG: cold shock domain-containing protein [Bacteroidota bacterium]|nr:cold shock domain-containing protein [Bacteroidota bacterium]